MVGAARADIVRVFCKARSRQLATIACQVMKGHVNSSYVPIFIYLQCSERHTDTELGAVFDGNVVRGRSLPGVSWAPVMREKVTYEVGE